MLTAQHNTLIHMYNIKFYNCLKCTYENFIIYYSNYFQNFFLFIFLKYRVPYLQSAFGNNNV